MNKENVPYIQTQVKRWLNASNIKHEAYNGSGFIVTLNNEADQQIKFLFRFEPEFKTANYYTVITHYPARGFVLKFLAKEPNNIIQKLLKYKLI